METKWHNIIAGYKSYILHSTRDACSSYNTNEASLQEKPVVWAHAPLPARESTSRSSFQSPKSSN